MTFAKIHYNICSILYLKFLKKYYKVHKVTSYLMLLILCGGYNRSIFPFHCKPPPVAPRSGLENLRLCFSCIGEWNVIASRMWDNLFPTTKGKNIVCLFKKNVTTWQLEKKTFLIPDTCSTSSSPSQTTAGRQSMSALSFKL